MILPLPTRSFEEWAREVVFQMGDTAIAMSGTALEWKTWARLLISVPPFDGMDVPSPEGYETWREWAQDLVLVNI